jgi:enoyl-[acyl-carrier protein] reductase I
MDWLGLEGRTVLVTGLKNKKSVAWHVGRRLAEVGATVIWSVHTEERAAEVRKLCPDDEILVCDVEDEAQIARLARGLGARKLDGLVHSIAFASYTPRSDNTQRAFHEVSRADFLRATSVSCFSLIALSNALKPSFTERASVVTISISTTRMASESYGYMAPIKAALDSAVVFLAKSFSRDTRVRFNSVNPGPLKTSASAGIPGYLDNYLFAETATLRKQAPSTEEVADAVLFLLSPRSAGINAQGLVIDAGMSVNYFDRDIVRRATRADEGA